MEQKDKTSVKELFQIKNFLYLVIGAFLSSPGYYAYLLGSEWLMLHISENRAYLGMLFIAASIPRLLFMIFGGIIADRMNKRTILFISDLTSGLLVSFLVALIWMDSVEVWHLITLAVFFGISDAFSHPAMNSLVAEILPDSHLQQGNSVLQVMQSISPIIGPVAGGTLIVTLGFKGVFTLSAISLMLAAWTVYRIKLQKEETPSDLPKNVLEDFKEGLKYGLQNKLLRTVMFVSLLLNFVVVGPLTMGIPLLVKDVFKENALGLTTLEASLGIGLLTGAVLLTVLKSIERPGLLAIGGLIAQSVLLAVIGLMPSHYFAAGILFIFGLLMQGVNIPIMTILQAKTEKKMLGRIMSLLMTASQGMIPVSYMVTSYLIAVGLSITSILLFAGSIMVIFSISIFLMKEIRQMSY
ncbi:MFS transporter [Pseudalkalibacillus caeni]|uniref:MFS transporter n=2 Tax=Exobacillus caeni TaxID=2574798 RepID=A0A5R9F6L8_9BACL|nr:MFS transporter [Pseudalkalibacillus caeni]